MAWAAVAVVAIYAALRPLHGSWIALAVALLTGTSPFFVRTFNFLFAEYPFLALLFGGCGMLHASARRGPRWWLWALGGALCLAAAAWLRTVAVLALPGALLVGLRADRGVQRWRPLVGAALPVLLILPWVLHSGRVAQGARSPADQFLLFDYGTAMLHVDPGDPASPRVDLAGWVERVAANGGQLLGDLDEQLAHLEGVTAWRWPAAVLVLAGLAVALRRRPSMFEAWTALYLALVLTYFVYANRLVQPLVPFLYLYALLALASLGRLVARRLGPVAGALPAAALFAALLLGNALAFGHHRSPRAWPYAGATQGQWWDDLEGVAAWVRENTPADATLLCNAAPTLSVMSGRRAYTYRFPRGTDLFQRYPIDYVVHDAGAVPAHVQQRILRAGRPPALVESHVPGQFIKIWPVR
jgi:4-amino-4-deoxy-L-arabinose transferase-like glycosyltransferase